MSILICRIALFIVFTFLFYFIGSNLGLFLFSLKVALYFCCSRLGRLQIPMLLFLNLKSYLCKSLIRLGIRQILRELLSPFLFPCWYKILCCSSILLLMPFKICDSICLAIDFFICFALFNLSIYFFRPTKRRYLLFLFSILVNFCL